VRNEPTEAQAKVLRRIAIERGCGLGTLEGRGEFGQDHLGDCEGDALEK
jgi:hypothetical protein